MRKIRIDETDVYMVRMSASELEDLIRALETACNKTLDIALDATSKGEDAIEAVAQWQLYSDCLLRLRGGNTFVV